MKIGALSLAGVLAAASSFANNISVIYPASVNDGYWHDESGSKYDFWNGTSASLPTHYRYFGTSDTLSWNTSFIQFDLHSIPTGALITEATLTLYLEDSFKTGSTPNAGSINHVADASSATGNANQRLGGNENVAIIDQQALDQAHDFVVTTYVQHDIGNGYGWSCYSLNANTDGDYSNRDAGFTVTSADAGDHKPALTIVYIPEPSSMAMGVAAVMAIAAIRRRHMG